jgi:hypothetical protein
MEVSWYMIPDPFRPVVPLEDLIRQASSGEPMAPEKIRDYLRRNPELAAHAGDVGRLAEESLIKLVCGTDTEAAECLKLKLDQMRRELGKASDPPTMRQLTDRAVLNWLYLHFLEVTCSQLEEQTDGVKPALLRKKRGRAEALLFCPQNA